MLVVLGGLPGVGKTSVARALARCLGAVHVRIDSIEVAIAASGDFAAPVVTAGYEVGYAVAADQLRLGLAVVADSVNPVEVTRRAWRHVGATSRVRMVEVELVCSDPALHRERVESRVADLLGHVLPTWAQVRERDYEPWAADLRVDTAVASVDHAVEAIVRLVGRR